MLHHFHSSAWVVTPGDWDDFHLATMFVAFVFFLFFPLTIHESAAAAEQTLLILTNTCNTRDSWQLDPSADACDGLLCCFRHLWVEQSHMDTDSSFIHVLKPIHLLVLFFSSLPVHTAFAHFPKECVYKLPINTRTHAHKQTRTPTVYIPLFPLCGRSHQHLSDALPPLSLVEARLAQVSVAKTKKIKQKCWMLSFV